MQPLNINFVIDRLKNLDPTKNSIDEKLALAPKMSFWEKWFVRILHFVTCGYYTKNAKLDEVTKKIVLCASEILPKEFEEEEQKQYINAFTILKNIDKENEGSEQDKIEQVITKIRASALKKSVLPEKQPGQELPPAPPFNPPVTPPRASSPLPEPPPFVPPAQSSVPSPPPPPHDPAAQPGAPEPVSTHQVLSLAKSHPLSNVQLTAEEILTHIQLRMFEDASLPPLVDKLAADKAFTGDLICKYDSSIAKLFGACEDNFNFKVIVAEKLLLQRNSYQVLESYFSEDVWKEVAKRWPLKEEVNSDRSPMNRKPEYIVAFANTLASRADAQNEKSGAHLFTSLINSLLTNHEMTHDLTHLKALSPHAVALAYIKNVNWKHLFEEKDAIAVIHPFFKAFIEQEPDAYKVAWLYVNENLPPENCKLLPWKEYPCWLQIFLSQRAGQLEDVAYLRNVCKEMKGEDTNKFLVQLRHCNPFPADLINVLVDPTLDVQPPAVQQLILKALEDPKIPIALSPKIWNSLDVSQVDNRHVRMRLLRLLDVPACRIALQAWENFNIFHFEENNPPPLAKYLQAQEDPESLRVAFELFFGDEDVFDIKNGLRRRIPYSCEDILNVMEETPWKLYAALYRSATPVKDDWQKRAEQYLKTIRIVQSHGEFLKQKDELKSKLFVQEFVVNQRNRLTGSKQVFRSNLLWNAVSQKSIMKEFFYAFLTHADPRSIALHLKADDELMMFLAILDETARTNLIKARGTSQAFTRLREVAQMMAESDHLPDEAKRQAAEFIKKLNASISSTTQV